jgi:N-acetylglucosamine-6-phosphate deacetylase
MTLYYAERLFNGVEVIKQCTFCVEHGLIKNISKVKQAPTENCIYLEGLVAAGFIDTQVNGGGGKLFNHEPTFNTLKIMSDAHARFGTTSMLPTVITDSLETMRQAACAIKQAHENQLSTIAGIHFEGPHLSQAKKGIHPASHVRHISDNELKLYEQTSLGKVLLTIAPETVSPDIIKDLVAKGVIVSLGHSNADIETALLAIEAGACATTHLFNAMSGLSARSPGIINAALCDERLTSGIIADLHHVSHHNLKLAYKSIGKQRLMLVTDSMAHTGSDLETLNWLDSRITRNGMRLSLDDGSIAGSCLDMNTAVKNIIEHAKVPTTDALYMASQTPANLIGAAHLGSLQTGLRADFIVLNEQMSVTQTFCAGELLFKE